MVKVFGDDEVTGRLSEHWTLVERHIEATFRANTYTAAAELVTEIGRAADAANHHPDLELRYPGIVRIVLTTHEAGGITGYDLELAAAIDALAADRGLDGPGPAEGPRAET